MVQEVGYAMLPEHEIELIADDSPTAFLDNGPPSSPYQIRQWHPAPDGSTAPAPTT
jgi:hypothetical protein